VSPGENFYCIIDMIRLLVRKREKYVFSTKFLDSISQKRKIKKTIYSIPKTHNEENIALKKN
jgi:hypothetical protein